MKNTIVAALSGTLTLTGCATPPKDIAAVPVSPMQYQSYDCNQLAAETQRIHIRLRQLNSELDKAASNDKIVAGVSVLVWPALFALSGTKQQEMEYGRLKGEFDATQQAAILKRCPGLVAPGQPTPRTTAPTPVIPKNREIPNAVSPR